MKDFSGGPSEIVTDHELGSWSTLDRTLLEIGPYLSRLVPFRSTSPPIG
jgi:hypothetical protein